GAQVPLAAGAEQVQPGVVRVLDPCRAPTLEPAFPLTCTPLEDDLERAFRCGVQHRFPLDRARVRVLSRDRAGPDRPGAAPRCTGYERDEGRQEDPASGAHGLVRRGSTPPPAPRA